MNAAYAVALFVLRPYNRKTFFFCDLGFTSLLCLGSLSNLAVATGNTTALKVGVYVRGGGGSQATDY